MSDDSSHDTISTQELRNDSYIPCLTYSKPKNSIENGVLQLNDEQLELLETLKQKMSEFLSQHTDYLDDPALLRFLRARQWNLHKAEDLAREATKWRASYCPEKITIEEIYHGASTGKMFIHGFDRRGRPTIYMRPLFENIDDENEKIKYVAFTLELASRLMPDGVEKINVIIDLKGYSLRKAISAGVTNESAKLFSAYYPERLGDAYIIHPPRIFDITWKIISPLLDSVTRKKIHFVTSDEARKKMLQNFDPDQLCAAYGGTSNFSYKADVYWECVRKVISGK